MMIIRVILVLQVATAQGKRDTGISFGIGAVVREQRLPGFDCGPMPNVGSVCC